MADEWDCEAYGPPAREAGTLCFFAPLGKRECISRAVCSVAIAAERQRVFRRMNEMAAHGDEAGAFLAETFTNPEQILGGGDEDG